MCAYVFESFEGYMNMLEGVFTIKNAFDSIISCDMLRFSTHENVIQCCGTIKNFHILQGHRFTCALNLPNIRHADIKGFTVSLNDLLEVSSSHVLTQ